MRGATSMLRVEFQGIPTLGCISSLCNATSQILRGCARSSNTKGLRAESCIVRPARRTIRSGGSTLQPAHIWISFPEWAAGIQGSDVCWPPVLGDRQLG